jgi:ATP-binding cassette subfamily C protein
MSPTPDGAGVVSEQPTSRAVGLKALVRILTRAGVGRVVRTVVLMAATSVSAAASILLLIPVLQAAALGGVDRAPDSSPVFAAMHRVLGGTPSLVTAVLALAAGALLQGLFTWWQMRSIDALKLDIKIGLRREVFENVLRMDWAQFTRLRSSDLLETLVRQIDRAELAAHYGLTLLAAVLTTAGYVALACGLSWSLAGIVVVCGLVVTLVMATLRRHAAHIGRDFSIADRALYRALTEALASVKLIRSFGAEAQHLAMVDRASDLWRTAQRRSTDIEAGLAIATNLSTILAAGTVTIVALQFLSLPAATVFVLLALCVRVSPQISQVQTHYHNLLVQLPAVVAVDELRQTIRPSSSAPGAVAMVDFSRAITLDAVSFAYDTAPVIDRVSLDIPAGATIAIVGSSGAGKSTLVDLILGLLQPASGAVRVDGQALTPSAAESWRTQVAYVPQDEFLFHDTVRANLQWAAPQATLAELEQALRLASAEFVFQLSDGIDTVVGDRGLRVSGGERQRLALARALLRRPKLLVLDEATSALDSVHEREIQRAIEQLHGTMTIVLVAHRLSTVRAADIIYVVEGGRIQEHGSWASLIARKGRLHALAEAQGAFGALDLAH